jgi:undecaprenyl-phosphate 4-deoxy-4-formamido-L-arabinose transferase
MHHRMALPNVDVVTGDNSGEPLPAGISVVVPAFNSAGTLPKLVSLLQETLETGSTRYELILVNDGSRDDTWETICRLAFQYDWIRGINLMRNYGQHNAVLCGIRHSRFAVTVTLDDDLQHLPEEIPALAARLNAGYDVVYGTSSRPRHGLFRSLASLVTKWVLQGTMGAENARSVSPYRALRTSLRESFAGYADPFVNLDVLLAWSTRRFASVPVDHQPRQQGRSNYSLSRLIRHAMNMITGFSSLPLHLASWIGFVFTLFGMAIFVFVVGRYLLQGVRAPGFTFLASAIAILAGAQLFALGIIGQYLSRMHFRLMDKPCYAIRQSVGATTQPSSEDESNVMTGERCSEGVHGV